MKLTTRIKTLRKTGKHFGYIDIIDKKLICLLYYKKKKSLRQIGDTFGLSKQGIGQIMERLNLDRRPVGRPIKILSDKK